MAFQRDGLFGFVRMLCSSGFFSFSFFLCFFVFVYICASSGLLFTYFIHSWIPSSFAITQTQKTHFVSMAKSKCIKLLEESHSKLRKQTKNWILSIFKGTGIYSYNENIPVVPYNDKQKFVLSFQNEVLRNCPHLPAVEDESYNSTTVYSNFTVKSETKTEKNIVNPHLSFTNAKEHHLNNPPFNWGQKLSSQAFGSSKC